MSLMGGGPGWMQGPMMAPMRGSANHGAPGLRRWRTIPGVVQPASVQQPHLALGERYRDAMRAEGPPDGQVDLRAHVVDALFRGDHPDPQLELEAVLAERHEPRGRCRVREHPLAPVGGLLHQRYRL